jgi:hypothetical protein
MDHYQPPQRFFHMPKFEQNAALQTRPWYHHRPQVKAQMHGQAQNQMMLTGPGANFNGKQIRKSIHRKTVDYNASVVKYLEVSSFANNWAGIAVVILKLNSKFVDW